jgi:GNAT superfamily N-acetyltransferase
MNPAPTPLSIRPATPADLPAVMSLIRKKAEFDGCPEAFQATPEALSQAWFADPPRGFVLVADIGDELVGVATYSHTFSTFVGRPGIWLDDLFVREECRGRGLGHRLITELARIAVGGGFGRIEWIVSAGNDRGLAFYERQQATISPTARYARLNQAALERLASGGLTNS